MSGNLRRLGGVLTHMKTIRVIAAALALGACSANAAGTSPIAPTAPAPTTVPPRTTTATTNATAPTTTTTATTATTNATAPTIATTATAATADPAVGVPGSTVTFGPMPNIAVVSADGRVAVVHDGVLAAAQKGLLAADGSSVITTTTTTTTTTSGAARTTVVWQGIREGSELARLSLAGDLTAVATDPTGKSVAFTEPNSASPGGTEVVIATPEGEQFRHAYSSELLPEGFSNIYTDSASVPAGLFVIEYLDPPPSDITAPRRYHVRVLDTSSGELALPLDLRDKSQTVDEQMLGFSRTHVLSPRNGLLFTLYRGIDSDEKDYAFVHTLGFVNGVYCLDLPQQLGLATLPGAVALLDDETQLAVVSANGVVSEFRISDITDSPKTPQPLQTKSVWPGANPTGPAVAAGGDTLLVGQDDALRWIDAKTLTIRAERHWDMQIEAVALTANGNAIAAGTGRVSEITPDGQLAAELPLPANFGRVSRVVFLGTASHS